MQAAKTRRLRRPLLRILYGDFLPEQVASGHSHACTYIREILRPAMIVPESKRLEQAQLLQGVSISHATDALRSSPHPTLIVTIAWLNKITHL